LSHFIFYIFIPLLYLGFPAEELEDVGWDSLKALVKHFAGKDNGDTWLSLSSQIKC